MPHENGSAIMHHQVLVQGVHDVISSDIRDIPVARGRRDAWCMPLVAAKSCDKKCKLAFIRASLHSEEYLFLSAVG